MKRAKKGPQRLTSTGVVLSLVGAKPIRPLGPPGSPAHQRPAQRPVLGYVPTENERRAQQAFADADAVLAQMNFKTSAARAKGLCTCFPTNDRSCESCVARDEILRSRGDYL